MAAGWETRDFFIRLWWYLSCMLQPRRRENFMKYSRFTRSGAVELQFWLRGRGIVARLSAFQFTTTVESQPAAVVSEASCV